MPGSSGSASILMRSPSRAPPLRPDEGSIARIPTVCPVRRAAAAMAETRVDLPTPGGPVHATSRPGRRPGSVQEFEARLGQVLPRHRQGPAPERGGALPALPPAGPRPATSRAVASRGAAAGLRQFGASSALRGDVPPWRQCCRSGRCIAVSPLDALTSWLLIFVSLVCFLTT